MLLHLISCYEEELVDRMLFKSSADGQEHRDILLPEYFTHNCAYQPGMLGRPCVTQSTRSFRLDTGNTLSKVRSFNAIAGAHYDDTGVE